jgi:hypothetical protein
MGNKYDYFLTAAKELRETSSETLENMNQFIDRLKETRDLYATDRDTNHSPLLSLGLTLLLLPDPVSTPIGAGMLLFGAVQEKIIGPPLYIKNVYEEFNQNVTDLMKGIGTMNTPSLSIELETLHIAPKNHVDKN